MGGKLGIVVVCLLFAVPFGGVGAGASWMIGATIHDGLRARDWVLVKARVEAFDRGQVSYRYTFNGREYAGDRIGSAALGGSDNIDSWHEEMAELLSAARRDGKPVTVFVNPDNPAESMVDRAIRWKLILFMLPFALGFGGVGLGALWFLGSTLRGSSSTHPEKAMAPAPIHPETSTVFARGMIANQAAPASPSSVRSFDTVLGDDGAPVAAASATDSPKLTPEQKAMIGKLSGSVPSLKKYVIWLVGFAFAVQFLPSILSLFTNR